MKDLPCFQTLTTASLSLTTSRQTWSQRLACKLRIPWLGLRPCHVPKKSSWALCLEKLLFLGVRRLLGLSTPPWNLKGVILWFDVLVRCSPP